MGSVARWQLRWLEPVLLLSRILFAMAAFYLVVGGVLDLRSVRAATWMAMVPFAGGLGIMVFTMGFGVTMAKAHNPERYAQRVRPSSIPARYRVNFFTTSYDRRDLHLERYVPGYRRSMRLAIGFEVLAGVLFIIDFVTNFFTASSGGKHAPFSSVAPMFAAAAMAVSLIAMLGLRGAIAWKATLASPPETD
jgi:hypothetical protein